MMNDIKEPVDKEMFDYTKLIAEEDAEGTWIILGISIFMLAVLILMVFV